MDVTIVWVIYNCKCFVAFAACASSPTYSHSWMKAHKAEFTDLKRKCVGDKVAESFRFLQFVGVNHKLDPTVVCACATGVADTCWAQVYNRFVRSDCGDDEINVAPRARRKLARGLETHNSICCASISLGCAHHRPVRASLRGGHWRLSLRCHCHADKRRVGGKCRCCTRRSVFVRSHRSTWRNMGLLYTYKRINENRLNEKRD